VSDVAEREREGLVSELVALVRTGQLETFAVRAAELEPADLADVLAALEDDERVTAVQALPAEISSQALIEMPDEEHAGETLAALDPEQAADIVQELADDDAADILGELEPAEQERILSEVEGEGRAEVEKLLVYDAESAGGLMTTRLVTVPDTVTVSEALDEVRRQTEEVEDFYEVFVVDARRTLVGVLSFRALAINPEWRPVREVMEPPVATVGPEEDQEEVARVMARYNLANVPVVDQHGQLLGCVTFDDVSDVVEAENTEDILRFGGVSAGEELKGTWQAAVKSRLPWLVLNLATAFVAGAVVLSRQDVISRIVLLAAYMPIVAGMGGNAGTQTLTVIVRGIALGELAWSNSRKALLKEALVGLGNGVILGATAAVVVWMVRGNPTLGLVLGLAMIINMFVAAAAGTLVPLGLRAANIDPALASSVFITTFTDMFGFFSFLGLATVFARYLV